MALYSRKRREMEMSGKARNTGARSAYADSCIHCHICQKHCAFLEKYKIDIGDTSRLSELKYHCFLCGKCSWVCPAGIDGREIVLQMRRKDVEQNRGRCSEKGYSMLLAEKQDYLFRNEKHIWGKSVVFPGCNFPSFYPVTTRKLVSALRQEAGMGVLFDCCGKPVAELGLKDRAGQIVRRIDETLRRAGAVEAVMVCPNCYDFLKDKLSVKVVTIYEKLFQLGIGRQVEGRAPLFLPCPDREARQWLSFIAPFLKEEPEPIENTQCCGLGGCAAGKEPQLARGMAQQVKEMEYERIFTYCASCAGNLTRNGCHGVTHILTEILECREKPDTAMSMFNRVKTKFW